MTEQILKIIRKYADYRKDHIKIWDKDLQNMVAELDQLCKENANKPVCDHEWVSSVAYKGAKVCYKCNTYK